MVNPDVMKLGKIKNVIGTETVGVDNGVRSYLVPDDWKSVSVRAFGMITT